MINALFLIFTSLRSFASCLFSGAVVCWLSVRTQHRCCQFDSSTCHNKNAIGEEGNGKPPYEFHFPRKHSASRLWFLPRLKLSMRPTQVYKYIYLSMIYTFIMHFCSHFSISAALNARSLSMATDITKRMGLPTVRHILMRWILMTC